MKILWRLNFSPVFLLRICFFHAIFSLHISNLQLNLYTAAFHRIFHPFFSMCTKQLNIGEEFRAEQKFSYYFIIVFIFRYWKLGGFHVTILIEEQPLYHTFSSPPLQRRRKCTRAKSSKTLPLVMILCLGLLCAIPNIVNRFWKLYWILRLHAVETKFCDLCLHLWSVPYRQAYVYFWKPLRGRSESAS